MDNIKKIAGGIYFVRTQAGFKKAIKDFDPDPAYKQPVHNWPNKYPSLVSFSIGYNGGNFIDCNVVHVNALIDKISATDITANERLNKAQQVINQQYLDLIELRKAARQVVGASKGTSAVRLNAALDGLEEQLTRTEPCCLKM